MPRQLEFHLYHKIESKLNLHKKVCVKFQPNVEFNRFVAHCAEFEEFCEGFNHQSIIRIDDHRNQLDLLLEHHQKLLECLSEYKVLLNIVHHQELEKVIEIGSDKNLLFYQEFFNRFEDNIKVLSSGIYNLKLLSNFQYKLEDIRQKYFVTVKNQINFLKSYPQDNRNYLKKFYSSLIRKATELILQYSGKLKIKMSNQSVQLDETDSIYNESIESGSDIIKQRFESEFEKQKEVINVQETEIDKLKEEIFGENDKLTSTEQLQRVSVVYHDQESDIKQKIYSIQALELTLDEMEKQITNLTQQKQQFESELDEKKYEMHENVNRLIHIEKLIDELTSKINEKTAEYQNKINKIEAEKLRILNDPNMTPAEKEALIAELNKEMIALINERESLLEIYAAKLDDLEMEAKQHAAILKASEHDIAQYLQAEINELEKSKIGASPSEILRIDAQIVQLKQQHQNNLSLIDQAEGRKEHFVDDNGRYFINENGVKVYQRHSNASVYLMDENGQLIRIQDDNKSSMIDYDSFQIEEASEEQKFFDDDNGRYYVDSLGRKIYKRESTSSEYVLIDGVMIKINEPMNDFDPVVTERKDEITEASGYTESLTSIGKFYIS